MGTRHTPSIILADHSDLIHARAVDRASETNMDMGHLYELYDTYRVLARDFPRHNFDIVVPVALAPVFVRVVAAAAIMYYELSVREEVCLITSVRHTLNLTDGITCTLIPTVTVTRTHRNGLSPEYFLQAAEYADRLYDTLVKTFFVPETV